MLFSAQLHCHGNLSLMTHIFAFDMTLQVLQVVLAVRLGLVVMLRCHQVQSLHRMMKCHLTMKMEN